MATSPALLLSGLFLLPCPACRTFQTQDQPCAGLDRHIAPASHRTRHLTCWPGLPLSKAKAMGTRAVQGHTGRGPLGQTPFSLEGRWLCFRSQPWRTIIGQKVTSCLLNPMFCFSKNISDRCCIGLLERLNKDSLNGNLKNIYNIHVVYTILLAPKMLVLVK